MKAMTETVFTNKYFGWDVVIYFDERWAGNPFPWMFGIQSKKDGRITFLGIPNKCETRRQALRRAWWRCKWKHEGTWSKHYE